MPLLHAILMPRLVKIGMDMVEEAAGGEEAMVAAVAVTAVAAADEEVVVAGEVVVGNSLGPAFKVCYDNFLGFGLLQYFASSLGAISLFIIWQHQRAF